jgi:hypothetical protein
MKKLYISILSVLFLNSAIAQTEISSFNAAGAGYSTASLTDYQCLGINPANLGWTANDHSWNLGFFEGAISIYSEPLTKKEVFHDLFNESITLSYKDKQKAAKEFTDARIWAQGAVTWFGISYQQENVGGFAFNIRDRGTWNSVLNNNAADFLFRGYNAPFFEYHVYDPGSETDTIGYTNPSNETRASEVYKGTDLDFIWYREFNFGYGRKIIEKDDWTWYAGIGLKYLIGYSGNQYYQNSQDSLVAFSSLSPVFNVDYGDPPLHPVTGNGLKKVGTGFGFDIGTTVKYKDLKVSLALNDIGNIKWTGNLYEGYDVHVYSMETTGIDNYNIFAQGQLIVADKAKGDTSQWIALENKKVKLPMNLRAGASYRFTEQIEVGTDLYVPLGKEVPGNYEKAIFGIGATYNPSHSVQLNVGIVTGGKLGTHIPLGVSFFPVNNDATAWQIGVAVHDALSLFKQNKPMVSLAFGFLRFSFGQKQSSTRYLEH